MSSPPTEIGIAVVIQGDRVLVGVRGDDSPLPGLAEFPGGKCLPDEIPAQCAARECREETGLEVVPRVLLDLRTQTYPHGELELHFWQCEPQNPADVAETHQGFRWVSREELGTLHFPEANQEVIELLLKRFD